MFSLTDNAEEAAFREEIRSWIESTIPRPLPSPLSVDERLAIDQLLARDGYLGMTWPVSYGGRGARAGLVAILQEELARVGASPVGSPSHQGIDIIGPTLMQFGSEWQKTLFLPRILSVSDFWCQGFSEPDAGSDLAGLQTLAKREEGAWVLTGTKIWTSMAHRANWIYVLARTGAKEARHRNLTMFLVPMDAAGIEVTPITKLTGERDFCQVRLSAIRVTDEYVLGPVDGGWGVAMWALGTERLAGRLRYFRFREDVADLCRKLATLRDHPMFPIWVSDFGRRYADIEALRPLNLKTESLSDAGRSVQELPSVAKIWWPIAHQGLCELGVRVEMADVSMDSAPASALAAGTDGIWYYRWLEARAESIYGGSAQIQRNILSERWLGLPRESSSR